MSRILVAEDESAIAKVMSAKFRKSGFDVAIVPDGKECITIVEKDPAFDIVLLDIIMPHMNGFDVLEHFNTIEQKTPPVVVLTNLRQIEDKDRAYKLGAIDFIVKSEVTIVDSTRHSELW
jgi:CheY-like chemotaxis protein